MKRLLDVLLGSALLLSLQGLYAASMTTPSGGYPGRVEPDAEGHWDGKRRTDARRPSGAPATARRHGLLHSLPGRLAIATALILLLGAAAFTFIATSTSTGEGGAKGVTSTTGDEGDRTEQGLSGAPGTSATRPPELTEVVDRAISDFGRLDNGELGVHPYAWMAKAVAVRHGWRHPLVAIYLDKVYAQQNPDGGYGLPEAWDAFQDGSLNSADTTYAVTLTDHVGPVFLEGWAAGVVPRSRVQQVVDSVEAFPLANVPGTCVSYSTAPVDAAWCVGNINSSAAYFLTQAVEAGFDADLSRVPAIVAHDRSTLIDGEWWPYIVGETRRQDWQHNALMVEVAMKLDPPVGRVTLDAMRRASTSNPFERVAMLRLARFDCSLANPEPLVAALAQHTGDAHYVGLLAYEGAVAVEACDR